MSSAVQKKTARALAKGKNPLGGEYGKRSQAAAEKAREKDYRAQIAKGTKLTQYGTKVDDFLAAPVAADRSSKYKTTDNRRSHFSGGYHSMQVSNMPSRDEASRAEFGTTFDAGVPWVHPALSYAAKAGGQSAETSSAAAAATSPERSLGYKVKAAVGLGYKGKHRK